MIVRHLFLGLLLLSSLSPLACGGDDESGACAVCDQATASDCQARCEEICDICSDVDPAAVESVECFGDTLNVFLEGNATVACNG